MCSESIYINSTIFHEKPTDSNRLDKEYAVYDLLDALHISYDRVDHAPAMTIEACQGVDELLQIRICKNLFLCNRQKTDFYLLIMPGDKPFKTKDLSAQLGVSRLSFAPESYMEELLNLTPGSVTIMGLMHDTDCRVRLLVDQDLLSEPYFGCHPCINTSSIKLHTDDVFQTLLPALKHEPTFVVL